MFHGRQFGRILAGMTVTWSRGEHPDLDPESGDVRWQSYLYTDPNERRFMQMWADDAERASFMARVAARQSEEDLVVQNFVQGRAYGAEGESAYRGYQRYQEMLKYARDQAATFQGGHTILHGDDVANMSEAEYDKYFDERGVPREGVIYRATSRDVPIDDGMDQTARSELRTRGVQA